MRKNQFNKSFVSPILLVALFIWTVGIPGIASAASLLQTSVALSSAKIGSVATSTTKFQTPTGVPLTTGSFVVNFQNPGFNFTGKAISTFLMTYGVTGGNATATIAAAPGAGVWGLVLSGASSTILTFTAPTSGTAINANDKVIIYSSSTNAINPLAAASYTVGITTSTGDTGTSTVNILNNDQVQLVATVAQTLTFSLSSNAVGFGPLTTANARFANTSSGVSADAEAHTVSVGTNAANGYTLTVNGSTLTYAANTINGIGAVAASSTPNTKQFGLRTTLNSGTGTVAAPYSAATSFAFNTGDTIASTVGSVAAAVYGIHYVANIDATTPAGTYNAAISYAATANF